MVLFLDTKYLTKFEEKFPKVIYTLINDDNLSPQSLPVTMF